jgi:nucleotidyltransferase/DNA polymerase involved in DNA repair
MSRAVQLCPDLVVLPHRMGTYRDYSRRVMKILRQTSPLVEQISVDEAFLDLTEQASPWERAIEIAAELQDRVREEIGLSASLGVATNKSVAKVASDRDKPGGLTVVRPGEEAAFLAPLPVRVLWGVGPVTAEKLAGMDIATVGDLARLSEEELQARFGSHGRGMARRARGIDNRPLVTEWDPKSVSQERTFRRDLVELQACKQQLWKMSQRIARRLNNTHMAAGTVAVKLRYTDFTTLSRQMTLDVATDEEKEIYRAALTLFQKAWQQGRPIRLLGVACRNLAPPAGQLSLWQE